MSTIFSNKKLSFFYETQKSFVAGLNLNAQQVSLIRNKKVDITNAFCLVKGKEVFCKQMYFFNKSFNKDIRLLLTKREIIYLKKHTNSSLCIVVESLFFFNSLIKMKICLSKRKKKYNFVGSKFKTKFIKKDTSGDEFSVES